MKTNRRKSREVAFTLLFEWSFREEELGDILADAAEGRGLVVDDFARSLLEKAVFNRAHIDNYIEKYSTGWKINRLSHVTLSVLRLSLCELLYFDDIPVGATINEAVELVKAYAGTEEAAFVNGVLGTFERDRAGDTPSAENPREAGTP